MPAVSKRTALILKWSPLALLVVGYVLFYIRSNLVLHAAYDQLDAAGYPMTPEDIIPPVVPDEDNAAILLNQAIDLIGPFGQAGVLDLRQMKSIADNYIAAPDDLLAKEEFEELINKPLLHDVFQLIEEAVKRPHCRVDLQYEDGAGMLMPHVSELRALTILLNAKALYHSEDKEWDQAWATTITMLAFSNVLEQEPLLISQLVRAAQFDLAVERIRSLADHSLPESDQYEQILGQLNRFWLKQPLLDAMHGERILCGEWFYNLPFGELMSEGGLLNKDEVLFGGILGWAFKPVLNFDHAAYLRHMYLFNHLIEEPYDPRAVKSESERFLSEARRYPVVSTIGVDYGSITSRFHKQYVMSRLTYVGLKLVHEKIEHGAYPEALEGLAEPEALTDPFTGKTFQYAKHEHGLVIYSLGPNQLDDFNMDALAGVDELFWVLEDKTESSGR